MTASQLWGALRVAGDRQATRLLTSARRSQQLVAISSPNQDADEPADAALVVVAADAPEAAQTAWVEKAVREGRAVAWGTRAKLGAAVGRRQATVVAVSGEGLGAALARAVRMAQTPAPFTDSRNVEVDASTEVR